jgi:hypothetical protein
MTNNKQQTAVEFYLDKVFDIIGDAILDKLSIEQINKIHDLSLQAKEMDKGIIIKAYNEDLYGGLSGQRKFNNGEDYYEQTYGGGEQ